MAVRVVPVKSVGGAKQYFAEGLARSDYYGQDGYTPGVWWGKGAERLGLQGQVEKQEFFRLLEGRDPKTGDKLTVRMKDNRRPGIELVFSGPKSFSSLWARASQHPELQERLLDVFKQSVIDTLREEVEPRIQTRLRRQGQDGDVTVGNALAALFTHFEARPEPDEKGRLTSDAHVHLHAFLMNLVMAPHENNRWQAAQFEDLFTENPLIEAAFEARLALAVRGLALDIERRVAANGRQSWEIEQFPQTVIDRDSRRTQVIDAEAARRGISDAAEKGRLGPKLRRKKQARMSRAEQFAYWDNERTSRQERQAIDALLERMANADPEDARGRAVSDPVLCRQSVDWSMRHLFERDAVVADWKLAHTALRYGYGGVSPEGIAEAIEERIKDGRLLEGWRQGKRLLTTPEAWEQEQRDIIAWARDGQGTRDPLGPADRAFTRDWLNDGQKAVAREIWDSCSRVILMGGPPGAGKTTVLQEVVEGIEAGGHKVFAFAPSAEASRGTLCQAGFDAETVAMLMKDPGLQSRVAGQVLLVDEASFLGTKDTAEFFRLCDRLDCRVVLLGDVGQHGAVNRPGALRLLETKAGLRVSRLVEIQRQRGEYKQIVERLSAGDTGGALEQMQALGWIREIKDDARRERELVADYLSVIRQRKKNGDLKTALVISPTHAEGERITGAIRAALKSKGKIKGKEHELVRLDKVELTQAEKEDPLRYRGDAGQVVQFFSNAGGFRRGDKLRVVGRDDLGRVCVQTSSGQVKPLRLDQADKFEVYRVKSLTLADGDKVRITGNGRDKSGEHRLNNGALYTVKKFTKAGDLLLENGWVVSKDYAHLTQGYVITSQASQSKTVDEVIGGMSSDSFAAMSRQGLLVTVSRGRSRAMLYCDDLEGLKDAVRRSEERLTATELLNGENQQEARRRWVEERTQEYRRWEEWRDQNIKIQRLAHQQLTRGLPDRGGNGPAAPTPTIDRTPGGGHGR